MTAVMRRVLYLCTLCVLSVSAPAAGQVATSFDPDTIRAGRFDMGKMWPFEYAPLQYFSETYGFDADAEWLRRARLAVLRVPGCSASFVSPDGLVVTNHHCVRNAITQITAAGESLLDDGFFARDLAAERRIPNYYADQLIAIEDVSAEVIAATDPVRDDAERQRVRRATLDRIEQRLRQQHAGGFAIHVQIIPLYQGGRYSAYVFRRFTDVRMVAAAELLLGFFGGDPDNFTYPRYALDFAFLRVYDERGEPYRPEQHFAWGAAGVAEGDAVFVIGNPGATSRLTTMAQLEFFRDVMLPAQIALFSSRLAALHAFYDADPARGEALNIRNRAFSISNTLKAATGRLDALHQPLVMARRAVAERQFLDSLRARPALQLQYGDVVERLAAVQQRKQALGREYGAFLQFGSAAYWPATLRRGVAAHELLAGRAAGAPADTLAARTQRLLRIGDNPRDLELDFLAGQFTDLQRSLGAADTIVRVALGGRTARDAAAAMLHGSVLADSAAVATAVAAGTLTMADPAVRLAVLMAPRQAAFAGEFGRLSAEESELQARLGQARFEIYGTSMPPDGTFSPRITDGVVSRYEYNGTLAPPYTTFYGMYDRYHSFGPGSDWDLPSRWLPAPPGLDLGTPLNFVSTADTYGGNSGSPAVTPRLEIVGLNFDRNIQGLSRDYIYLPERGRNIMVDVRAIGAALDAVYDLHRVLLEVTTGRLYRTEAEADAARRRN
jgi:hypothetical protein